MKFLAILRDSLLEAIDAKVFYVMLGLSLLLIALASTATFRPGPGGQMVLSLAAVPLTVDLADLDLANPEPERLLAEMSRRLRGGIYEVAKVEPAPGYEDRPDSLFRVFLSSRPNLMHLGEALKESPEEHIRKNFGVLGKWRLAEVVEVKRIPKGPPLGPLVLNLFAAEYEVLARVADGGRRLWPHSFSLFFGALPLFDGGRSTTQGPRGVAQPLDGGDPAGGHFGIPLGLQLYVLEDYVVNGIGAWVAILVSIIISAFFIPNMLRKGTIDLLLAKPIGRVTLLLYKFVGGLLFIFINTAVAIAGVWLALSLRSGLWAPAFLLSIPIITFFFAILYAVSTLFGVLTRSPIVAILLTIAVWFVLWIVGVLQVFFEDSFKKENQARARVVPQVLTAAIGAGTAPLGPGPLLLAGSLSLPPPSHPHGPPLMFDRPYSSAMLTESVFADNWFPRIVAGVHYVLPRTRNLTDLTTLVLMRDLIFNNQVGAQKLKPVPISWGESLTVSGLFIALMLGLSCWRFATRDY